MVRNEPAQGNQKLMEAYKQGTNVTVGTEARINPFMNGPFV